MRGKRTSWELEGHVMPVFIIPMPVGCMACTVPRGTTMRRELCRSNMQGEFRGCRYGGGGSYEECVYGRYRSCCSRSGPRWESKPRLWRYPSLVEGALPEVVVDIVEGLARKDMWSSLWSRVGEFVGRDEGTA